MRAESPTAPAERKDAPLKRALPPDEEKFVDATEEARTAAAGDDDLADAVDLVRGTARRAEVAPIIIST